MIIFIRILTVIAIHIFLYLIESFIAWDFNPLHWKLFSTTIGKTLFLFLYLPSEFILIRETISED